MLESTFAVAAVPGLLPLPSSEDCVESSSGEEAERLAEPSASDTAALGSVAALLPRPSSSPLPSAETVELLAVATELLTSVAPSLEAVSAKLLSSVAPSLEALEAVAAHPLTSDSDAAAGLLAAADLLAELSGSDSETASDGGAFPDTVAATEEVAVGEGLEASSSLSQSGEDIAAAPRKQAIGDRRMSPKQKTTEEDEDEDDAEDGEEVG